MKITSVQFVKSAVRPDQYPAGDISEVAFAGPSNVGKSSLINALVGRRHLAKTSQTPGRTQLINFYRINESLSLVDLPGYGYAKVPDPVRRRWGAMVEGYLTRRKTLRLVVLILDIRRDVSENDRQLVLWLRERGIPLLPVLTKCDKISRNARALRRRCLGEQLGLADAMPLPVFSARTGEGREALWSHIQEVLKAA